MTSIGIRKYEENKDLDSIKVLWNSIIDDGESYLYNEHFSTEQINQLLKSQDAVYCAVNDKNEVVGFYLLHPNFPGRGKHIANASYGVSKNCRGFGIGKILGKHSLKIARELGFKAIQFNAVVSSNTGAVRLWESLGFERVGEIPKAFLRNDGDVVSLYVYYKSI